MWAKRPAEWSWVRWLRTRRQAGAEPAETPEPAQPAGPAPEEAQEPGAVDMLRRTSDVALRLLILGVVIYLLLYGLTYIQVVVIPLVLAVFLTALLKPPADWMRRKGLGRGLSTTLSIVGALVVFSAVLTLVVQPAISGFGGLVASVNEAVRSLKDLFNTLGLDPKLLDQTIVSAQDEITNFLKENGQDIVSGVWTASTAVLEVLVGLILVIVLTVYFVHSGDTLVAWCRTLFPAPSRRPLQAAGEIVYGVMGRYVRGVALVGLIDAIGIGAFLIFLIDPALAIPLIFLTFIGAFLPVIGAFLTGLLAALVAFVTEGWIVALIVVAVVLVVQQLESHVFAPRVYGRALELPSAVVLLAIAIGSIVAGVIGMFLATPIAAVVAALLRDRPFVSHAPSGEPTPPAADPPDDGGTGTETGGRTART